jgi:hypothetical protein
MAHQSGQNCIAQTCISESGGYPLKSGPQRTSYLPPSQILSIYEAGPHLASRVARGAAVLEIGSCDTILGDEIPDSREKLFAKAPGCSGKFDRFHSVFSLSD